MGRFKFEGDLTDISEKQLEFLSDVLEERGFKDEKVDIQVLGKDGDNYASNVKKITVVKQGKTFSMIAKIAPKAEAHRRVMNSYHLFQNEHVMYTNVLPKCTELEIAADIPENERLRYTECYGTYMELLDELILLEDLNLSDYKMLDRFASLTDDTVRLVLKNFAKLHSFSYALKKQDPETYAAYKSQFWIIENFWILLDQNEQMQYYFQSLENDLLQLLDDKYKIYAKESLSQITKHAAKVYEMDMESEYSVIQHGDAWNNNMMFRFKDDQVADCCMIDYQISKPSSPVADLHHLIFNCTDYKTRSKHYHDWLDYYYTELDKSLSNYGLKASEVYPKDQLDAESRRCGKFSLSASLLMASVLLRQSADASKVKAALFEEPAEGEKFEETMNSIQISTLDENTVSTYVKKVKDLINSFVELGYV